VSKSCSETGKFSAALWHLAEKCGKAGLQNCYKGMAGYCVGATFGHLENSRISNGWLCSQDGQWFDATDWYPNKFMFPLNFVQHSEQIPGSICIGRMLRSELPVMDATLISTKFCKRSDHFFPKSLVIELPVWQESFRSHMFTIVHQTLVFPLCVYDFYICLCVSVRPNRLPAIWPGGWMIPVMANGWKLWKANVFDQCLFLNQWLAGIRCTTCRDFKGPKAIHIIYLECRIESRPWYIYIYLCVCKSLTLKGTDNHKCCIWYGFVWEYGIPKSAG
jgi:hypothetical protein